MFHAYASFDYYFATTTTTTISNGFIVRRKKGISQRFEAVLRSLEFAPFTSSFEDENCAN